jgi:hypothetical protein
MKTNVSKLSGDQRVKPVMYFGYILLVLSVINFVFFYRVSQQDKDIPWLYIVSSDLFLVITGAGLITLKKWGYNLFKILLYVQLLAFPIGTIISYKVLLYMKKNNIRSLLS